MAVEILAVVAAIFGAGAFAAYYQVRRSERDSANLLTGTKASGSLPASATSKSGAIAPRLEQTRRQTSKAKFLIHLEKEGTQLSQAGYQLEEQYDALLTLLATKFLPTEITYSRYLSGIEEACLSIAENLAQLNNTLDHLDRTFESKDPNWEVSRSQSVERLDSIKAALTALSELYVKLNQTDTQERHRSHLESSIEEVRRLSERAKLYERS